MGSLPHVYRMMAVLIVVLLLGGDKKSQSRDINYNCTVEGTRMRLKIWTRLFVTIRDLEFAAGYLEAALKENCRPSL